MNFKIEPHYFPLINYFLLFLEHKENFIISVCNYFRKQSLQNRSYILTSQKIEKLIVPIIKKSCYGPFENVLIDYSTKWHKRHFKAICTAYGKAPYFIHYIDQIESILNSEPKFLYELNMLTFKFALTELEIDISIQLERNKGIRPSNSNLSSLNNLNLLKYRYEYNQIFSNEFVANMSIIDLLMCQGPNSINILKNSTYAGV